MILQRIDITNFKNIRRATLEFSPKINIFLGDNGMGKSNLLDAIHTLSFAKSYTGLPDQALTTTGEDFTIVQGQYLRRDTPETVSLGMGAGRRKTLKRGEKAYRRISEHIGVFPLVLSSPADMELAGGAPEYRRRFMDQVISQSDPIYLEALIRYNQALEQRNSMLRSQMTDPLLYGAIEHAMADAAETITRRRIDFTNALTEIFAPYHRDITDGSDRVTIAYAGALADGRPLQDLLDQNRQRDLILHHTSAGPHRDDLELTLNDLPLRRTASQGQAKSYTIALRLAQYDFLRHATGITPLLLLDDLFDKLDAARVRRIVSIVARDSFGQIFITDTGREQADFDAYHWQVTNGCFTRL